MNEADTWFEDKFQEVENEEQQLRKLSAVVDSLVNHRKELCMNTALFAKSMAMLGNSEDNTALSRALSQLAEVEDKMEALHQEQAANDFFVLGELLCDYIRLVGAVRGCFDQRMRAWQRWQDAQSSLQKKREAEAKLLWANKPDKLQQAKDDITEWESRVTQYERDFDRVGMMVRKEVLRFEKEKVKDFKSQIIRYLESMLQSQQRKEKVKDFKSQIIRYLESMLQSQQRVSAPSHPHVVKTASIGTLGRTRTPMIVTVPNAPDVPETSRMLEDVDSVQVSQVQDISCSLCLSISPSPCPPNLTDLGLLSPLSPSPPSSPLALLQVLASLTPSSASRSNAPPPVPLPQSYEPDELTEEMAHLEGLMKDLNAITTAP
uniref:Uncharacterized protein n=1 Tax=Knipowitschia caucasica TaxID=637954 RepID=A0AAV2LVH4_KNICA